jgi:hypothetical protein
MKNRNGSRQLQEELYERRAGIGKAFANPLRRAEIIFPTACRIPV